MHARYIALINPGTDADDDGRSGDAASLLRRLKGFDPVLEIEGLIVFSEIQSPLMVAREGVLFGTVFSGDEDATHVRSLSAIDWVEVSRSGGRFLIDRFWGGYLAILPDEASRQVHVVRSPLGDVPCYHLRRGALTVIASDVALLIAAGCLRPTIDWAYVTGHLLHDHFRPLATGLAGVTELLGGTRLTVAPLENRIEELWSPWTFAARTRQIAEAATASDRVRATTIGCTNAWGSLFRHIVLGVSGGLDSSIVAACLARGSTPVSCITLATRDAGGDERLQARDLTAHLGLPLHEDFEDLALVDLCRSDAAHLPRPLARAFAQSGNRLNLDLAERVGADAFFSGAGGDNIFCYLTSAAPIADRLLAHGPGPGFFRTARDISRLTGASIWTAASMGIKRAWFRQHGYEWPRNATFLTDSAVERAAVPDRHPWLEAPRTALPGKAAHIAWLLGIQNHLEGFNREHTHAMVAPLLSQPLVELCLQIPSWMWCANGENRSIARRAFSQDLPASVIKRRSKGSPGSFVIEIYEAHREVVRALLSDGLLAQAGLLDVDAISAVIDDPRPVRAEHYSRIMGLVDVEVWLRSWETRRLGRP